MLMTEAWNNTKLLPLRKILNENVSVAAAHLTFQDLFPFLGGGISLCGFSVVWLEVGP